MVPASPRDLVLTLAGAFLLSLALGWEWRPVPAVAPSSAQRATDNSGQPDESLAAHAATPLAKGNDAASEAGQAFETATAAQGSTYQQRLRLAQAAAGLDREEVLTALEQQRSRYHGVASNTALALPTEALLARYAELDPAAATIWLVQSYEAIDIDGSWLAATLDRWLSKDRAAVLTWAQGLPRGGSLRARVVSDLLDRLTNSDPEAALSQIDALHAEKNKIKAVFTKFAGRDPAAAYTRALQLPVAESGAAVGGVMEFWGAHDGPAAYACASQMPPGILRKTAMDNLMGAWELRHPAAAAAFLLTQHGPEVKDYVQSVASEWSLDAPEAALRWVEQLPHSERLAALSTVVESWADHAPRAAVAYAMSLPRSEGKDSLDGALRNWSYDDPAAALSWAQSLPPGTSRTDALTTVYQRWADKDPQACVAFLSQQPNQKGAPEDLDVALKGWAARAPIDVWQWSRGLSDPVRRDKAGAAAVQELASADPVQAAALLAQLRADQQTDPAEEIAGKWAKLDLAATLQWAGTLPAGKVRAAAWSGLITGWAAFDAPSAAAWIGGQPAGKERDAGIDSLVYANSSLGPADALRLACSMQDNKQRAQAVSGVAATWLQADRPAAMAWISQAPELTDAQRTELLETGKDEEAAGP